MLRAAKCLLICRLSFRTLIGECFKSSAQRRTLFWDPYSKELDFFSSVMFLVFPRDLVSATYSSFLRLFGVTLLPVPHADQVENYHVLQLKAENETRLLLAAYFNHSKFDVISRYKNFNFDQHCLSSMTLQQLGVTLYCLIENIKVLKTIGFATITVEVHKRTYPRALCEIFMREYSIILENSKDSFFPFSGFAVFLFFTWVCLKDYVVDIYKRIIFKIVPKPKIGSENPLIAVEFVDPLLFSGSPTEPNYIVKHGYSEEAVVFYSRTTQFKDLWKGAYSYKKTRGHINPIHLPSGSRGLKIQAKLFFDLLKGTLDGSISVTTLKRDLGLVSTYKDLESLFTFLPIRAHLYNIIPNGRVSTRFDSGLVTGVCRRFEVRSLSYQSRVMYRHNLYYHFNVFDIFFFWGSAWAEEYKIDQFIEKYEIIGNVNNFSEFLSSGINKSLPKRNADSIAIFPSDINSKIAYHYTEDYTEKFLSSCFEAIYEFQKFENKIFKVYIKFKEESHKIWFYQNTKLNNIINQHNLFIEVDDSKKYDVQHLICSVNKVIAIGFTTPGFDAMCLGKSSIFFTPYTGVYNGIFNDKSPLVANTVGDLLLFLSKGVDRNASEIQRGVTLGFDCDETPGIKLCRFIKDDLQQFATSWR